MLRRLSRLIFALLFAGLGVVAGRLVADWRAQRDTGTLPVLNLERARTNVRPRDVVPGVVAALRVSDRPWSFLHIAPWVAAFGVNFTLAAYAREIREFTGMGPSPAERPVEHDGAPAARTDAPTTFTDWGSVPSTPAAAGDAAPDASSSFRPFTAR